MPNLNYNTQLQSNNTDLQAILNSINELPEADGGEQATPVISVNSSNGLITVTAGTKSSTHQLAFQAAKTITPSTASQIAVSSGYYTGGNITVAGDTNLIAGNIKSGVSIFGVNGTLVEGGGSGGDTIVEDELIARTLTNYTNDRVTAIGSYAFYNYSRLTTVSLPNVTSIGSNAFYSCSSITTANFPKVINISNSVFMRCRTLSSLTLGASTVCTLSNSNAFSSTPYAGYSASFSGTPYIYVPSSLVASYQAATNWTYFSNYFSAIEGSGGDTGGGDTGSGDTGGGSGEVEGPGGGPV